MLIALTSIFLSTHFASATEDYCPFTFLEIVSPKTEVLESSDDYFYFDVEGYKKKSISDLTKSGEFSIQEDFGSIILVRNDGTKITYQAESVSLHIPPEHSISEEADLEVMIYHSLPDSVGKDLVISYLFSTKEGDETSSRVFFNDLLDAEDGSSDIDPTDVSGGFYNIKEFYYNDEERVTSTSHECNKYKWVIYSNVIKMSKSNFKDISEKLVTVDTEKRLSIEVEYVQYTGSQDEYSSMLFIGVFYLIA